MWRAMFVEQIPLAEKVLRTVLVYALIALLFRVAQASGGWPTSTRSTSW